MTQGRLLIAHLKRKPHTYWQMLKLGISLAPWARVKESLREGEHLFKRLDKHGRTTWMVTK